MEKDLGEVMNDGTTAYLTYSKRYYVRREPDVHYWSHIVYYGLDKNRIHLAKAKCKLCGEIMESKCCGDFQPCKCGASFVDTDRWLPERHRYGGETEPF